MTREELDGNIFTILSGNIPQVRMIKDNIDLYTSELQKENEGLKDRLYYWQHERCEECGGIITMCGKPDIDGSPNEGCEVCQLKQRIKELEKENEELKGDNALLEDRCSRCNS